MSFWMPPVDNLEGTLYIYIQPKYYVTFHCEAGCIVNWNLTYMSLYIQDAFDAQTWVHIEEL